MVDRPTLLIVDDEEEIRLMLSRHFRLAGYEVVTAGDAAAAEEALRERRFDVMISDIMMPGDRIGTDLLLTIRDEYPMTRAIMITGYVTLGNALTCMRRGADTVVFKPLDKMDELDEAVGRALAHNRRWQEKLAMLRGMKSLGGRHER